jgi:hypothetical protein
MMTSDELSFLLRLARVIVGAGFAMAFERERGGGIRVECCAPYSRPSEVIIEVVSDAYAKSDLGAVVTAHDVARRLRDRAEATDHETRDRTPDPAYPYRWRVRTRLAERFGMRCRVLVRGALNSALVEFADGFQVVTSRNYVRQVSS